MKKMMMVFLSQKDHFFMLPKYEHYFPIEKLFYPFLIQHSYKNIYFIAHFKLFKITNEFIYFF